MNKMSKFNHGEVGAIMRQSSDETTMTDQILRAQGGDRRALEDLIAAHYTPMYRLGLRYSGDPEMARDAVQDACIQVMRNFDQLRDPRRFKPWMNRIVINCVRLNQRRNRRFVDMGDGFERANIDFLPLADELMLSREALGMVDEFLREGTSDEMDIFMRLYVTGEKVATVSRETGVSVAALKTRVHRARRRLRDYLVTQYDNTPSYRPVAV
jgi:RNA polymerase sigma-70 factor (ECF subfamily)